MTNDKDSSTIQRYLGVIPLFLDLSLEERVRLGEGCQLRRLSRGDMVFRAGDPCEAFHVVIVGQVKLFVSNAAGQEKIIELVGAGHSFAEAMMFLNKPYILNVQALADSLLLDVSKQAVITEIERDPRFAMHMLAGISRRLHGLVRDVESYALQSGMQRLIGYLLSEASVDSNDVSESLMLSLQVSKASVASRLSLTPEYFSRVLHELETQGLIAIDKRDIRVLDQKRLASYGSQ